VFLLRILVFQLLHSNLSVYGGWLLHNVGKVTEGVACRDRTDAARDDDNTDDGINARPATQTGQSRTHEKADMAVVSAAFPGDNETEDLKV